MSEKSTSDNKTKPRKSVRQKPTKRVKPSKKPDVSSAASNRGEARTAQVEPAESKDVRRASSSARKSRKASSSEEKSRKANPFEEKPRRGHRWVRIAVIAVVALVLAAAGLFAWNRWFRYDDAADMQGEWKVADKQYTIVMDGSTMKLTGDVSYGYTIDPFAKTITYTFGTSSGHGSYRFSEDRQTLVIEDGKGTDWLMVLHLESDPVLEGGQMGQGVSLLTKISSNTAASPQSLVNHSTADANAAGTALDDSQTDAADSTSTQTDTASQGSTQTGTVSQGSVQ